MGTEPATLYAWANIEVPQWGALLGTDPRTGQDVWETVNGPDGRQLFVTYKRGQVIDATHFRQADLDELMQWQSIGTTPPEPVVVPGTNTPVPEGAVAVTGTDAAQAADAAVTPAPAPPA